MAKSPAFQFYANEWLSSTKIALMTPAQEGAYIRLLCHAWNDPDCSIPDSDEELAALSRLGEGWFKDGSTKIRKCFEPHPEIPGRLVNLRLLEERAKQETWREKSRLGGIQSGKTRKGGKNDENQPETVKGGSRVVEGWFNQNPNQNPTLLSSSSSSFSSSEEEEKKKGSRSTSERSRRKTQCDGDWLKELQENPAYQGIDVNRLYGKMVAWCKEKNKQPTRLRLLNWLNREDVPLRPDMPSIGEEGAKASKPLSPVGEALCAAVGWQPGALDHSQYFTICEAERQIAIHPSAMPERIVQAGGFYRSQKRFSFSPKWISRDWGQIETWLAAQEAGELSQSVDELKAQMSQEYEQLRTKTGRVH